MGTFCNQKTSICSYQFNIWYAGHRPAHILIWFLAFGQGSEACLTLTTGCLGIALQPSAAHSYTKKISLPFISSCYVTRNSWEPMWAIVSHNRSGFGIWQTQYNYYRKINHSLEGDLHYHNISFYISYWCPSKLQEYFTGKGEKALFYGESPHTPWKPKL